MNGCIGLQNFKVTKDRLWSLAPWIPENEEGKTSQDGLKKLESPLQVARGTLKFLEGRSKQG